MKLMLEKDVVPKAILTFIVEMEEKATIETKIGL